MLDTDEKEKGVRGGVYLAELIVGWPVSIRTGSYHREGLQCAVVATRCPLVHSILTLDGRYIFVRVSERRKHFKLTQVLWVEL